MHELGIAVDGFKDGRTVGTIVGKNDVGCDVRGELVVGVKELGFCDIGKRDGALVSIVCVGVTVGNNVGLLDGANKVGGIVGKKETGFRDIGLTEIGTFVDGLELLILTDGEIFGLQLLGETEGVVDCCFGAVGYSYI